MVLIYFVYLEKKQKMEKSEIKAYFLSLAPKEQGELLSDLELMKSDAEYSLLDIREYKLNNKQGSCPHCGHNKYTKNGKYNKTQRYKCKACKCTFSPYTGTWLAQIHKKEMIEPYLKLMRKGLSLEKIKTKLKINKKTAFDWRHKINISLLESDKDTFEGITESDETFFLHSETGSGKLTRKARKRGKSVKKKGIGKEQVAVIVSADRKGSLSLKASGFGRISKSDIDKAIGNKTSSKTVLCSDSHVSYKGFAFDKNIEHHAIKVSINEFVKNKLYHIQNINSMHSRLKTWINRSLYGVATKYLQNYLNWFRYKEKYKKDDYMLHIMKHSMLNINARKQYLYAVKKVYSGKTTPF